MFGESGLLERREWFIYVRCRVATNVRIKVVKYTCVYIMVVQDRAP